MPPMRSVPENPSADPHPRTPSASPPPPPPPPPRPPTPPARRDTRGPLYTVPAHKRFKLIERSCRARSATYAILSQDPLVKELAYTATPYYYTSDVKGFVPALDCHGLPCTGPELPIEEQRLVCKLCSAEVRPRDGFTLLGSWVKHKKRCVKQATRERARLEERQRAAREAMETIKREKREAKRPQKQEKNAEKQEEKVEKAEKEKGDSPPAQTSEEVREQVRDDWRVVDWAEEVGVTEITEGITQVKMRIVKKRR
ncbi:hypothetical protein EV714DRAFT_274182 [Schizophyllum commune]